jgi:hypothetical protein
VTLEASGVAGRWQGGAERRCELLLHALTDRARERRPSRAVPCLEARGVEGSPVNRPEKQSQPEGDQSAPWRVRSNRKHHRARNAGHLPGVSGSSGRIPCGVPHRAHRPWVLWAPGVPCALFTKRVEGMLTPRARKRRENGIA